MKVSCPITSPSPSSAVETVRSCLSRTPELCDSSQSRARRFLTALEKLVLLILTTFSSLFLTRQPTATRLDQGNMQAGGWGETEETPIRQEKGIQFALNSDQPGARWVGRK